MTLIERAAAYNASFAKFPASHLRVVQERGGDVLYGTWVLGNDYRNKTPYYGAYPPGYLERMAALFPDATADPTKALHVFGGSLPRSSHYTTVDINPDLDPDFCCSVYDLPDRINLALGQRHGRFGLVLADPPYSAADAEKYGTAMVDRRRAIAALAQVTRVGGHLVWLDVCWPMHRKAEWRTVGRVTLIRSTNHRVRLISIFERQAV